MRMGRALDLLWFPNLEDHFLLHNNEPTKVYTISNESSSTYDINFTIDCIVSKLADCILFGPYSSTDLFKA